MPEFWEASFQGKQMMWGFTPSDAAVATAQLFHSKGFGSILIPGFGYGRNAKVFTDLSLEVTGIEISETAINLAKQHYGGKVKVYHGSVDAMPFDAEVYDGIFCYALIHLLNEAARRKLIRDCYNQLKPGGIMVFVAISVNDPAYGQGERISENRYETKHGVQLYFYDAGAVQNEFGTYGLQGAVEMNEPAKQTGPKPPQRFWQISCTKPS